MIMTLLLQHVPGSAKSDTPNLAGETPLLCAAKQGHVEAG